MQELGLEVEIQELSDSTRTAQEAADAVGADVGQIVKSLVFVADGEPVLALTSGANRVDPAKIAALCRTSGARKATAEEVRASTGYAIGGTPPFGHARPLRCFVDQDMMPFDRVWAAAGTPEGVFPLTPQDLVRASGGTVATFAETRPSG